MTNSDLKIRIARVEASHDDLPLPSYATFGSAGMDLRAAVHDPLVIRPGETVLIPTGFRIELSQGYEAQVRPRSGLAASHSIGVLNSPGTVDSDYRGEIKVILTNFSKEDFTVRKGDRIAQLVIARYIRASWEEVVAVEHTERGSGGFGHTGR